MTLIALAEINYSIPRALCGIIGLLAVAFLLSTDRKRINKRVVLGGLGLQLIIAFGVLKIAWVEALFGWIAHLFSVALQVSVDASAFVFGTLADFDKMNEVFVS